MVWVVWMIDGLMKDGVWMMESFGKVREEEDNVGLLRILTLELGFAWRDGRH